MADRLKGNRHPHYHPRYLLEALTLPVALLLVAIAAALSSVIGHWD